MQTGKNPFSVKGYGLFNRKKNMTLLKRVLIGVYAACIMYCTLNLVIGEFGIAEKRRLTSYRDVLNENLQELESINLSLREKALSLRQQANTLKVYARDLDYYEKNEGIILLNDWDKTDSSYSMGKMLAWTRKTDDKAVLFRILSICFGLIIALLFTFIQTGALHGSSLRKIRNL